MSKNNNSIISVIALVVAGVALVMCSICCMGKKGGNVEDVLMNKPEIIINAMQKYEQTAREQAMAEANKTIADNLEEINNNPNSAVMGNPQGKIVLVEFFDFSCGYCHRLYPVMKSIIAKNPELKVVTKELAFVSPTSDYAARASLAAKEQGKYNEMYNAIFSYQGQLNETKVDELATKIGLDMTKYKADLTGEKVKSIMAANSELARKINVSGVPTMVLNGKLLQTIDEGVIQSEIDALK